MENQNSAIVLYQAIKSKTDEQTAHHTVAALQGTIKEEVKNETNIIIIDVKVALIDRINSTRIELLDRINSVEIKLDNKLNSIKIELLDRINSVELRLEEKISASKFQTIMWIVSMSVIQLVARYFFK